MKKIISIIAMIAVLGSSVGYAVAADFKPTSKAKLYPTMVKIISVDVDNDWITGIDANGNCWSWDGGDDWEVDDYVALIMNDFSTPNYIYDDEIVDMRYCGYAELFN